ncbi:MAG: hypothetical protein ABID54_10630 [Pseudomonadota bacterium]
MKEELRQKAIRRYLKGEKPKSIYTDLSRSKVWDRGGDVGSEATYGKWLTPDIPSEFAERLTAEVFTLSNT